MENQGIQTQSENIASRPYFTQHMERRKYERFKLQNAVFLFTKPHIVKTAIIKNISLGGLSYRCAQSERHPCRSFLVDLLTADLNHCLRLEKLPVQRIGEPATVCIQIEGYSQKKSLFMTDCRLRFQDLRPYQRKRLKFLIRNYTLMSV